MNNKQFEKRENGKPKTIALYLPQFHRIPENDEWWGEGYTDWTAVKAAEKLYAEHNQPRVPLHHNYYDLLEYDTMAWQAELMHRYHVDGMCMYHYWFAKGRKLLEKPAENLLRWKDIPMPFCFCWANITWARTWAKIRCSDSWIMGKEIQNNPEESGVLLGQYYGREKDWEEHFQYLLPFFRDDRYIKVDDKPVFLIYEPLFIFSLWDMMQYFQTRAKENGLPGIYVIGMEEDQLPGTDAAFIKQPKQSKKDVMPKCRLTEYPLRWSYDRIWEAILEKKVQGKTTYLCGLVDFDDTPRRGKKGSIMDEASPEKFYGYFKKLYQKSMLLNHEFVFLNAWNEWGEGMYLEPDEAYGYGYLEAVKRVVEECREALPEEKAAAEDFLETEEERSSREKEKSIQILRRHDRLLDDWLYLRDHEINVSQFFNRYGYRNIAIYGMGKLGRHLLHELTQGGIRVVYGIDKNNGACGKIMGIEIYASGQKMPEVDAVVMTVIDQYAEISKMLGEKMKCPKITIEEIFQELILEQQ